MSAPAGTYCVHCLLPSPVPSSPIFASHSLALSVARPEQRLRAQLEKDLAATRRRLEAAKKARDAAIKTLEQAAIRGTTSRKPQR